jgi:hypothetical protein
VKKKILMSTLQQWSRFLVATVLVSVVGTPTAWALSISSTVAQSGSSGSPNPHPITAPAFPFDFSGQEFTALVTIAGISVTLTMFDGDSGPGDFDFDDLTLGLDGIDTGIKLNGFRDAETVTQTILGVPTSAAAILASLQSDGLLAGTVIDADLATVGPSNEITFANTFDTTLTISGPVPEPSTLVLLTSGVVGLAGMFRGRKKKGGSHRNEAPLDEPLGN